MTPDRPQHPSANLKATRREWTGLAILALPCLLYSMDFTVLNLAVPHLTAEMKPTATELLWILDIYGFMLAGLLITMGTLGDRIGRRKLLLIGAAAFGTASLVAAFSVNAEMLIASRAVLGVAAATLAPSTLSLIRNMFHDERQRRFAIGVWLACFSAGAAIGPVLGGVLLSQFWWGSVFLLNVPVMLLLLAVGPTLLPEYRNPEARTPDLLSVLLSIAAVLSVIWGIKHLAVDGPSAPTGIAIAAGLVLAALFYWRQLRLKDPLIDVALFRSAPFRTALTVNLLMIFMAFGTFLFIAQYLQLVLGMGPLEAGLWTAPSGVVFVLGAMLAPVFARHFSAADIIAAGLAIAAVGFATLVFLAQDGSLAVLMTGMILFCAGTSPIGTLTTDLALSMAEPERAGAASAISETSFELGGALGMAVLGSIVSAIYQAVMPATLAGGLSVPPIALETLGGAVNAAELLSEPGKAALLSAARQAFAYAFAGASLACVAISMLTAYLAQTQLRQIRVEDPRRHTL